MKRFTNTIINKNPNIKLGYSLENIEYMQKKIDELKDK